MKKITILGMAMSLVSICSLAGCTDVYTTEASYSRVHHYPYRPVPVYENRIHREPVPVPVSPRPYPVPSDRIHHDPIPVPSDRIHRDPVPVPVPSDRIHRDPIPGGNDFMSGVPTPGVQVR